MKTSTPTRVATYVHTAAPMAHDANAISIDVYYDKGGTNYFSGNSDARGYWLSTMPVERKDGSTSFIIGSNGGRRFFIEPAARFNAKRLAELGAKLHAHDAALAASCEAGAFDSIRALVSETLGKAAAA